MNQVLKLNKKREVKQLKQALTPVPPKQNTIAKEYGLQKKLKSGMQLTMQQQQRVKFVQDSLDRQPHHHFEKRFQRGSSPLKKTQIGTFSLPRITSTKEFSSTYRPIPITSTHAPSSPKKQKLSQKNFFPENSALPYTSEQVKPSLLVKEIIYAYGEKKG